MPLKTTIKLLKYVHYADKTVTINEFSIVPQQFCQLRRLSYRVSKVNKVADNGHPSWTDEFCSVTQMGLYTRDN